MNTRLKLPLCGIILAVFLFSPPVCSGSGQLYTAAYTASGGSETAQVLIDGGPAYFLYRPEHAPSGPLGSYRRYTGLEDTQPLPVREEQVLALLGSGYPFNIGGAKQQYGLTDAEAYRLTQQALWILTGQDDGYESPDLTPEQTAYLHALLAAGQEAAPALSRLDLSPDTVRFTQTEQEFRTDVIQSNILPFGSLDFSGLPAHIRVLSEEGTPISSPAAAGSRFILASDGPVPSGVLTLRYLCPAPILYRYDPSGDGSGALIRAGRNSSSETVSVHLTVESTLETPASQNPGTGRTLFTAMCALGVAGLCILLLSVPIRRRKRTAGK